MKILVTSANVLIPPERLIGDRPIFEFDDSGLAKISTASGRVITELDLSVQSFAQAVQYAIDGEPHLLDDPDVSDYHRHRAERDLRSILENRNPNFEITLLMPKPLLTIKLNEYWLRIAAENTERRLDYYGLLATNRQPMAPVANPNRTSRKKPSSVPT